MLSFDEIVEKLNIAKDKYGMSELAEGGDFEVEGLPSAKVVESIGGSEGGGETVIRVLHFPDDETPVSPGIYVKFTGWYQSHYGTEWNEDFTQVFPHQETITVYK